MFPKLRFFNLAIFLFLFQVSIYAGTNPFLAVATEVVSCPSDGSQLANIYRCNYNDTHTVEVTDANVLTVNWQLLDSGSCTTGQDDCPNKNVSCTWNTVSTTTSLVMDAIGEYRVILTYANELNEVFYAKRIAINQPWAIHKQSDVSAPGASDGELHIIADASSSFQYRLTTDGGLTFGPYQNNYVFSNLSTGYYSINAKSNYGNCEYTLGPVQLGEPELIAQLSQTDVSCVNGGTLEVIASGGLAPFEYSLNGGAFGTSSVFNQLVPGEYTVEVRDALDVSLILNITIVPPSPITASYNSQDIICNGDSNGIIFIDDVSGGNGNYQYQLTNNGVSTGYLATNSFEDLAPGNYEVSVKDSGDCYATTSTIIIVEPEPLEMGFDVVKESSQNAQDGSIILQAYGGWGNYEYSIDNGLTFQASNVFEGLSAGQYEVFVSDGFFCLKSVLVEVTIVEDVTLSLVAEIQNQITCSTNARVLLTASGGTPPYEFKVDNSSYRTTNPFIVGSIGSKTFTVRDADGNTAISNTVTITSEENTVKGYVGASYDCDGIDLPFVKFYLTQGSGNMQYSLYDGVWQSDPIFLDVLDGDYIVRAKNDDCEIAFNFNVKNVVPVNARLLEQNGDKVKVQITSGTAPFTYTIDDDSTQRFSVGDSTIFEVEGFSPGRHWLRISGKNCSDLVLFEIEGHIPELEVQTEVTDVSCFGASDASIVVTGVGGRGEYRYGLAKGDGEIVYYVGDESTFTGLAPGTYKALLRDVQLGRLIRSEIITISEPTELISTLLSTKASESNTSNGEAKLEVSGGIGPYEYSLDGTTFESLIDFNITNLAVGDHTVFIRDINACMTELAFSITELEDESGKSFNVFQNTGHTEIIDLILKEIPKSFTSIIVYNSKGHIVFSTSINQGEVQTQINVNELARGVYFIYIKNDGIEEVKKVLII